MLSEVEIHIDGIGKVCPFNIFYIYSRLKLDGSYLLSFYKNGKIEIKKATAKDYSRRELIELMRYLKCWVFSYNRGHINQTAFSRYEFYYENDLGEEFFIDLYKEYNLFLERENYQGMLLTGKRELL